VTDSNSYTVTSPTLSYTVVSGPSIIMPTSSPKGSVDLGQPVAFSTSASGGSGGYSYTWTGLPTGCSSVSSSNVSCTPTATGLFSVQVSVVDSLGGSATSVPVVFSVNTDPTIGVITVTPRTIDVGQTMVFSLSGPSTGGAAPYRYLWTELPPGCLSNDSLTIVCTPIHAYVGSVEVTVFDANNVTNSTTAPWVVYLDPTLVGVAASPKSVDLGQSVTFSPLGLAEGSGGYSYRWSGLPAGCAGGNRSTIECSPSTVGRVQVTLNVTDSNGRSVNGTVAFTVDPDPTVGTPNAKPGSVSVGHSVTFSANVTGGSGNFSYNWSGLPAGCASVDARNVTCTPSGTGTTQVVVTVTDSNGFKVASAALPYTVTSSNSGILSLPVFEGWAVVAEAAVVAVLAIVVYLARRARRRKNQPPS
jgi:hypothetical protein